MEPANDKTVRQLLEEYEVEAKKRPAEAHWLALGTMVEIQKVMFQEMKSAVSADPKPWSGPYPEYHPTAQDRRDHPFVHLVDLACGEPPRSRVTLTWRGRLWAIRDNIRHYWYRFVAYTNLHGAWFAAGLLLACLLLGIAIGARWIRWGSH